MTSKSNPPVELDFFSMERERRKRPISAVRRRDVQGIVSKLNPEIVKTVIQSASLGPNKADENQTFFSPLSLKNNAETEKMTIVYNGKVFDFDLSAIKVHSILKIAAEEKVSKSTETRILSCEHDLLETLESDLGLPLARRKTLFTFLEKRKGRMVLPRGLSQAKV